MMTCSIVMLTVSCFGHISVIVLFLDDSRVEIPAPPP
jgi:hypothetical protein